ncbi:MAG: DNA-directed DNA polymerase [Candidatus Micrarchaeia archaeon]
MKEKGILIDVDYETRKNEIDIAIPKIFFKTKKGVLELYDRNFFYYFYVEAEKSQLESLNKNFIKIEEVEKFFLGEKKRVCKVFVLHPRYAREEIPFTTYETDIPFNRRYLMERNLLPLRAYEIEFDEKTKEINSFRLLDGEEEKEVQEKIPLKIFCYDIEVRNPKREPDPKKDEIIMISYFTEEGGKVLTTKEPKNKLDFVEIVKDEKELIKRFCEEARKYDILVGYNSFLFDLPYLKQRAQKLGVKLQLGSEPSFKIEKRGLVKAVNIAGKQSLDFYYVIKFLSTVGAQVHLLKLPSFTLERVYEELTGKKKVTIEKSEIYKLWDSNKIEELCYYSFDDSKSLMEIVKEFLPIEMELTKIIGFSLFEIAPSTPGQLVELFLIRKSFENNELIPNRPDKEEIEKRMQEQVKGAFVKTPEPGIYDNIVVFDFRSMYPSIIVSHNISPSSLIKNKKEKEENVFVSPTGARFLKEPMATIPKALKLLLDERANVKKQLKQNPNDTLLLSRSQALKIVANAFYGYLGYARSRFYSKECAESITAYGRYYIGLIIKKAEEEGFKVLYGDTDSIFIQLGSKTKEEAYEFAKKVNSILPKNMELELEGFYPRGVFVTKKAKEEIGAKKKYALISEEGNIKIRGFEFVRRDWSRIAKITQQKLLEAILKKGEKEEAIKVVKEVVKNLKEGRVNLKDLVIYTRIRKDLRSYDVTSPEVSAALKAIKEGKKRREDIEGNVIGYIITKQGSTISEKATLEEFAKDYDANYYINHQVLPAALKILKELGIKEEELTKFKQKTLF